MNGGDASAQLSIRGRIAHLQLNRPQALNALNLEMIQMIIETLRRFADDADVDGVFLSGAGERAFCAGVDVKSAYFAGRAGDRGRDGTLPADLFRTEYTMNHHIATFPKPYAAYWDGFVMGGGVGVSVMGSHRIATDRTLFAMPETGIGLFPDVGASYFLSRLGPIGKLLGLTGLSIDGAAALELGLATHFVPHQQRDPLWEAIFTKGIESAVDSFAIEPRVSDEWKKLRPLADHCFDSDCVESILHQLEAVGRGDSDLAGIARDVRQQLLARSPTSLKVTMELFRLGRRMTFDQCLVMEYRASQVCLERDDFYEGVRAVLVDKDRSPNWNPSTVQQVDEQVIADHFRSLGDRDLKLSLHGEDAHADG